MIRGFVPTILLAAAAFGPPLAFAQESPSGTADADAMAKQLSNPVAALISVPIQVNYDQDIGPVRAGDRWTINVQPVIPFTLNEDWNLISRTIVPIVVQDDIFPGSGSQSGLGDIAQSLFFSPRKPSEGGWIWGAGPVFLLPTATDDLMGNHGMIVILTYRAAMRGLQIAALAVGVPVVVEDFQFLRERGCEWHSGGRRLDPDQLYQAKPLRQTLQGVFLLCARQRALTWRWKSSTRPTRGRVS